MDFQRLFKRKEDGSEPPIVRSNPRDSFNAKDVLVCEGELLDGTTPACLAWSTVGGNIRVKADKIVGILEGRTRIKAATLQELYPALFEKAPNPGAEYTIPLQTVVMQLEELFPCRSSEELDLEDFATPFGRLAREDEARLKDHDENRPEAAKTAAPKLFMLPQPSAPPDLEKADVNPEREKSTLASTQGQETILPGDENISLDGTPPAVENDSSPAEQTNSSTEKLIPASVTPSALSTGSPLSSGARKIRNEKIRREGHDRLQELYLTDEPLDGSKVAEMILLLPRVAGVVIMLSDGAALGGGITGGLSESLISLTPGFVKHLSNFITNIRIPLNFITFSGITCQLSLTMAGDVVILAGHEGKNIPPGLRERLVATAEALNLIYGLPS
jgi:hypothetical protein